MPVAFVSGHRDLTQEEFDTYYKPALDAAIKNNDPILVCDYYGADFMAQKYLKEKEYFNATVVNMFHTPRNYCECFANLGGFKSDEERDCYCTKNSDYDIAWSRRVGSGTWQNIERRKQFDKNNKNVES